jgi:hypothetical protein
LSFKRKTGSFLLLKRYFQQESPMLKVITHEATGDHILLLTGKRKDGSFFARPIRVESVRAVYGNEWCDDSKPGCVVELSRVGYPVQEYRQDVINAITACGHTLEE